MKGWNENIDNFDLSFRFSERNIENLPRSRERKTTRRLFVMNGKYISVNKNLLVRGILRMQFITISHN